MSKRLINILVNGTRTFITPVSLFVISLIITRIYNQHLWGEFVTEMLLINLLTHVTQWGNKDYLLRLFSKAPFNISKLFYSNLFSRAFFLIPAILILYITSNDSYKATLLSLWLISQFTYLSAESLIIYTKVFQKQLLIEIVAVTVILLFIFNNQDLGIIHLIEFFTLTAVLKSILASLIVFPKLATPSIRLSEITNTIPFFIIGLSGLLQSRVDQYIIALYEQSDVIGSYQIFLSAFILLQSFSVIILVPFNNILYRANIKLLNKLLPKMLGIGIVIVVLFGSIISIILLHVFELNIPYYYLITGMLFALPSFLYIPIIYQFYRANKEKEVVVINYIGAIINLAITFLFVINNMPFAAIIGGAIAQWSMLAWYIKRKTAIFYEIKMS